MNTKKVHPALRWRIVTVLLAVSLLPICLLGIGSWVVFGKLLDQKALELQRTLVRSHSRAIEEYLDERIHLLRFIAKSHSLDEITGPDVLTRIFNSHRESGEGGFVDLGVIDAEGHHLAYTGPYDLKRMNYREEDWFKEVMTGGVFISDVFLGFRQAPHCIVAVKTENGGESWVIRGTINSNYFNQLVRTGGPFVTGEAFIVNRDGILQTSGRIGSVLDKVNLPQILPHRDVSDHRMEIEGDENILVTAWINDGRWMLVVQENADEVRAPLLKAATKGAIVLSISVVLVIVTTFLATWHLSNIIDKANRQRDEMSKAFIRSAKLASIGELATGLAHEINNPLAIISAEQTNIADLVSEMSSDTMNRDDVLKTTERCKRQINRCAGITSKMLQFGRKHETRLEPTMVKPLLGGIVEMLKRQAQIRNIEIMLDADNGLPKVWLDRMELEQIIINLVNNSFHALPDGGHITIMAKVQDDDGIIEVCDDGVGISRENLDRIFEPFFTTKSVGQGTGLGLSVCYGIVHSWGGRIEAESNQEKGTTIRIRVPLREDSDSLEKVEEK